MKKSDPIANSQKGKPPTKSKKSLLLPEQVDLKDTVGQQEISKFPEPPVPVCNLKIGSMDFWSYVLKDFHPEIEKHQIYVRHLRDCTMCCQIVDEYLETHPESRVIFSKKIFWEIQIRAVSYSKSKGSNFIKPFPFLSVRGNPSYFFII